VRFTSFHDLARFWGLKSIDQIGWAHAVNSARDLETYLADSTVHMVEGDVSVSDRGELIMAHPPVRESDLALNEWANALVGSDRGIKLDFKSPQVIAGALTLLDQLDPQVPVLVNADVLRGPGGGEPRINPQQFIGLCQRIYPDAILSVGWITKHLAEGSYTDNEVDQMLDLVTDYPGLVTFPIRAMYVKSSLPQLQRLLQREQYSLTIWNSELVDEDLEKFVGDNLGLSRCFWDLMGQRRLVATGRA